MTVEQIEESVGKDSMPSVLGIIGICGIMFAILIGTATYASVVNSKETEQNSERIPHPLGWG